MTQSMDWSQTRPLHCKAEEMMINIRMLFVTITRHVGDDNDDDADDDDDGDDDNDDAFCQLQAEM